MCTVFTGLCAGLGTTHADKMADDVQTFMRPELSKVPSSKFDSHAHMCRSSNFIQLSHGCLELNSQNTSKVQTFKAVQKSRAIPSLISSLLRLPSTEARKRQTAPSASREKHPRVLVHEGAVSGKHASLLISIAAFLADLHCSLADLHCSPTPTLADLTLQQQLAMISNFKLSHSHGA